MRPYRQRVAVQKQPPKQKKTEFDPFVKAKKPASETTREYIARAIRMYKEAAKGFPPLSDEEKICRDEILKYTIDLERYDRGTYEERKEVIAKYGRKR